MLTETENQIVEKGTEYRKCLQKLRIKLLKKGTEYRKCLPKLRIKLLKRVQNTENAYIN